MMRGGWETWEGRREGGREERGREKGRERRRERREEGGSGRERERRKGKERGEGEKGRRKEARMIHYHKNTIQATTHPPPPVCRRTEVVRAAVEGEGQPLSSAVPASSISFSFCAVQGVH